MKIYLPINEVMLKPVYLLYGYDPSLIVDALTQIKSIFSEAKHYSFPNIQQFIDFFNNQKYELLNQDLFFGLQIYKVLEINIGEANFNKNQLNKIDDLFKLLSGTNNVMVIFVADKLNKAAEHSKWFQYIDCNGLILISKNLSVKQFKNWAQQKFKQANLNITMQALDRFVQAFHNNLLAAKQNLIKLQFIYGVDCLNNLPKNNFLDVAEILEHIDLEQAKYSLFDLQQALLIKNSQKTITILQNLQQQDVEPILVLWGIIQALKEQTNKLRCINKIPLQLAKLWQQTAIIDLKIKQIDSVDMVPPEYVWSLLQELCIAF